MKYLIFSIAICFISCSTNSGKKAEETAEQITEKLLKERDSVNTLVNEGTCTLNKDTFSFKKIKLGMSIKEITGISYSSYPYIIDAPIAEADWLYLEGTDKINPNGVNTIKQITFKGNKKENYYNAYNNYSKSMEKKHKIYTYNNHYTNTIMKLNGVKTFEILDRTNYTIFNYPTNKIYLSFLNDKLFNIYILLNNNISKEIGEKFGNCKTNSNNIRLENDKLVIDCGDNYLDVSDKKTDVLLLNLIDLKNKDKAKEDLKKLNDF